MKDFTSLRPDMLAITLIARTGSPIWVLVCVRLKNGKTYQLYDCKRFYNTADARLWVNSHGDLTDLHVYYSPEQLPLPRAAQGHHYPRSDRKGQ